MSEFWTTPPRDPVPTHPAEKYFPVHEGKTYIVTGAAGGIGKSLVQALASEGARLAIWDLNGSALEEVSAEFGGRKDILPVVCDLGDEKSVNDAVAASVKHFGKLNGIVNNAAVVVRSDPLDNSWQDWQKVMAVNVYGAYAASSLVAKSMIESKSRGAIVNVASEAGKKGHTQSLVYSSSKAAMICMTRILSVALAPFDINANCVCPGGVATNMLRLAAANYARLSGGEQDKVYSQLVSSQLKRHVMPDEVARAVSFLLTDGAMSIRGQAINTDGGDTPY